MLAGFGYLVLHGGTFYGVLGWEETAFLHLLQWIGAWAGAVLLWRNGALRRRLGRAVPSLAAACVLWVALAGSRSVAPRAALPALLALPGALGWGVVACATLRERCAALMTARASAGMVLVLAIWSFIAYRQGITVRPALPLGHHNFLAGSLILLLGPAAALCWVGGKRRFDRVLGGAALVVGLMTLAGTSSLSGAFGAAGAAGIATLAVHFGRRHTDRQTRLWRWPVLGALALALIAFTPGGARIFDRAVAVATGGADLSLRNRVDYTTGALAALFDERPMRGFGAGSVALLFPRYRVQRWEPDEVGKVVTQLHCTPSHLLFEIGSPGLVLALSLAGWIWARAWRGLSRDPGGGERALRLGACAGLGGYALAALGDYQLHLAAIDALLALAVGLALGAGRSDGTRPPSTPPGRAPAAAEGVADPRVAARVAALVLAGCATLGWVRLLPIDRAHRAWDRALDATLEPSDLDAAARHARRAAELDPALGFYQQGLADLLQRQGSNVSLDELARLRQDAARAQPHAPTFAARAGEAWLAAGRAAEALPWLRLAVALDQASPLTWFHLARSAEALGDRARALDHWAHALALEPALQGAELFFDPEKRALARCLALRLYAPDQVAGIEQLDPPAPWRPQALLRTTIDDDRWRSTAAFVFRRRGLPGAALELPLSLGPPFGGGMVAEGAELQRAAALPALPSRAVELLERRRWELPRRQSAP